jgi:hypothetical protein
LLRRPGSKQARRQVKNTWHRPCGVEPGRSFLGQSFRHRPRGLRRAKAQATHRAPRPDARDRQLRRQPGPAARRMIRRRLQLPESPLTPTAGPATIRHSPYEFSPGLWLARRGGSVTIVPAGGRARSPARRAAPRITCRSWSISDTTYPEHPRQNELNPGGTPQM